MAFLGQQNVGGTQKPFVDGYVNVGGVLKKIVGGYQNVGGVLVPLLADNGITVGSLAVGSSVWMNVGGTRTEFLVIHQGLPSSVYDSSCNGTWVLMKNIHGTETWEDTYEAGICDYGNSKYPAYLNTFVNSIDSGVRSIVKQVKIPYRKKSGSTLTLATGSSGFLAKAFLLAIQEVGLSSSSYNEGFPTLAYFAGASNDTRIAYLNGTATKWTLRSISTSTGAAAVDNRGRYYYINGYNDQGGVRPAMVLPSDALVDENNNVIV